GQPGWGRSARAPSSETDAAAGRARPAAAPGTTARGPKAPGRARVRPRGRTGRGAPTRTSGVSSEVELDALGQRQRVGVVDGVGLAAHVGAPRVRTRLAATAGLLLAAEGAADLGAGGADVVVGDAAGRTR